MATAFDQEALAAEVEYQIQEAYTRFAHSLSWRFSYTPRSTFSPDTKMMFLGANPGGGEDDLAPKMFVEEGNAYRVERWGKNGQPNPLQNQVGLLFKAIADERGDITRNVLMDQCLTSNLVPFRSPGLPKMPNRKRSLDFSRSLWSLLMAQLRPTAIVCMGEEPYPAMVHILLNEGYSPVRPERVADVNWEGRTSRETWLAGPDGEVYVVGLPHLSTYKIVGRPASAAALNPIIDQLAATT